MENALPRRARVRTLRHRQAQPGAAARAEAARNAAAHRRAGDRMITLLVCVFGAIAAVLVVTLIFARRAAERVAKLEAEKLVRSFERDAIDEAERKKRTPSSRGSARKG